MAAISFVGALGLALALGPQSAPRSDGAAERLYGSVLTAAGERLEGFLRWDRNETHWADFLDGRRPIAREHEREAERLDPLLRARRERERSITLPNVRITWDEDDGVLPETAPAAVRFAHVRSLEVTGRRSATVVLTSADTLEMVAGSSDLGPGLRELVVEDATRGDVELDWDELARVDFMAAPTGRAPPRSRRLHGTVTARDGTELTGFIAWDMDETLTTDVLDGERGREDVRLPFGDIAALAKQDRSSTRVTLVGGEEMVLDGTNDVDASNRGIEITDEVTGRTVVDWDDFVSLRLHARATDAPRVDRDAFAAGGRLRGTVAATDGRRATGLIRWDNSAEHAWESLHATSGGTQLVIELGRVLSIAKGVDGARVTLTDGRVLEVDANGDEDGDFGEGSRGVFVETDGGATVMVPWRDFLTVTFEP
jgi:hypothetical protein